MFLVPVQPQTVGSTSATLYSKISTNKNPSVTSQGVSILGLGQGWGFNNLCEVCAWCWWLPDGSLSSFIQQIYFLRSFLCQALSQTLEM